MKKNKSKASSNYELAFYEAQSFLIAAEAISKKAQSIMFSQDGSERNIGLQYAKHVNHSYAFELLLFVSTGSS